MRCRGSGLHKQLIPFPGLHQEDFPRRRYGANNGTRDDILEGPLSTTEIRRLAFDNDRSGEVLKQRLDGGTRITTGITAARAAAL